MYVRARSVALCFWLARVSLAFHVMVSALSLSHAHTYSFIKHTQELLDQLEGVFESYAEKENRMEYLRNLASVEVTAFHCEQVCGWTRVCVWFMEQQDQLTHLIHLPPSPRLSLASLPSHHRTAWLASATGGSNATRPSATSAATACRSDRPKSDSSCAPAAAARARPRSSAPAARPRRPVPSAGSGTGGLKARARPASRRRPVRRGPVAVASRSRSLPLLSSIATRTCRRSMNENDRGALGFWFVAWLG